MPRRLIDFGAKPLLDIASYARRGPGRRDHLSHDEIELISSDSAPHSGGHGQSAQ